MASKLSGVFKQRKHGLGSPSKSRRKKKASKLSPTAAATANLAGDTNDDHDDAEQLLREFDMDMYYGPCIGVSRMQRWLRAESQGLKPPVHVKDVLERVGGEPECLWEGRV